MKFVKSFGNERFFGAEKFLISKNCVQVGEPSFCVIYFKRRFLEHSKAPGTSVKWFDARLKLNLFRLMHGEIFESHFKAKIGHPKIQILVRSSHPDFTCIF